VSEAKPASHRVLLLSITTKTDRRFRFTDYVFLLELASDFLTTSFAASVMYAAYSKETNNALLTESFSPYSERFKEQLTSRRAS
jgi:hypothetical protein